jgi:hypothetical protein
MARPDEHSHAEDRAWPLNVLYAVQHREMDALNRILQDRPETQHFRERDAGMTPLHMAAAYGYPEMVSLLLSQDGAPLDERDDLDRTPWDVAQETGNTECAELLLRAACPEVFEEDEPYPEEHGDDQA